MFETLLAGDSSAGPATSSQVLEDLRAARVEELDAAARQLGLAATWADLHPVARDESHAGWGPVDLYGEHVVALAGQGAPLVAEFAPAELAAHLGIGHEAGKLLVGDALELRHRLPRLWDLVQALVVPAWRARQVASLSTRLSPEMATRADKMISCDPTHLTLPLIRRIIEEAELYYDPDLAHAREQAALAARHVTLSHDHCHATTDVTMVLDTDDALAFEATLADIAASLRALGDTDDLDIRRARAVGVLADPQHALDLLTGDQTPGAETTDEAGAAPQPDERAPSPTPTRAHPRGGRIELFLHVDAADLTDPDTGAISERLGILTRTLLAQWLGLEHPTFGSVVVRPVLDLGSPEATDTHDPPAWMRQAATLRDATCVFPGCHRTSTACDLDHIGPWIATSQGGPPGQTRLTNLAPLCRTHHRIKTHGGWTYQRLTENHYTWTTPAGELLHVSTRRHHQHTRHRHRHRHRQP